MIEHEAVIRKVIDSGVSGQVGWMPECTCQKWKTAVLCGTFDAALRSWERNHVAHFMSDEEIRVRRQESRERIRAKVLDRFLV